MCSSQQIPAGSSRGNLTYIGLHSTKTCCNSKEVLGIPTSSCSMLQAVSQSVSTKPRQTRFNHVIKPSAMDCTTQICCCQQEPVQTK